MLEISNLHATIADKPILNGISLAVPAGEVHEIMGPNGSGKSTLGYVLSGRPGYEVTDGSVTFAGQDLLAMHGFGQIRIGQPGARRPKRLTWAGQDGR